MTCRKFRRLVDAYLGDWIGAEQVEEFELHYFSCADCFHELQIGETLQRKDVRIAAPEPTRFFMLKPMLALSGVLVAALALIFVVQQGRQERWLAEITRFEPPPFITSQSRAISERESGVEIRFLRAMELYNENRFRQALDLLEPLCAAHPDMAKFNFFTGMCRLLSDRPADAVPLFDAIIRTMNPAYYDEAVYYKGIALLRDGEVDAAKRQFSQLAGMFSPLSDRAREMIGRIDRHSR